MPRYQFPLASVLKLRRQECDLRRQALGQVLLQELTLTEQWRATQSHWLRQLDELRQLERAGQNVDIDASRARRTYAAQLAGDLSDLDTRRAALARQIDECRQAVVRADQAVQSLEKLDERSRAEFRALEEQAAARELEQAWLARNAVQNSACFGVRG